MSDPTPHGMLKIFRQKSALFVNEQAKMFNAMPLKDRLELVFYMCAHTNEMVRILHSKVDPEADTELKDMPDPERPQ